MYKVDLALRKKKETKLECYEEKCGTFELTIAENTLKFLPKEQHIYTAKCGNCKKAIAVKAKELLSFERLQYLWRKQHLLVFLEIQLRYS